MVVDTVDKSEIYRLEVLGVPLCVDVDFGVGLHEVIVDEIRVSCDFDEPHLNGLLCEDAQLAVETAVIWELGREYPRKDITIAKHVDEVLG